jgi:hypothetical protein
LRNGRPVPAPALFVDTRSIAAEQRGELPPVDRRCRV